MKWFWKLFVFFCFSNDVEGQNLIHNGDFEEYTRCPDDYKIIGFAGIYSDIQLAKGWINPTHSSPDYYNRCSDGRFSSVPHNFCGTREAYSGNAYVGIIIKFDPTYQEYIETKLLFPLEKGKLYCIKVHVSLGDAQKFAIYGITASLTKKKLHSGNKKQLNCPNHFIMRNGNLLKDKNGWMTINAIYKATGGEQFLTIGNLDDTVPFKEIKTKKSEIGTETEEHGTYYFIDDISLEPISDSSKCNCIEYLYENKPVVSIENLDTVKKEQILVLKGVYFKTGKFELLKEADEELDKISQYLKQDTTRAVVIQGYTDSVGKETDNLKLSEARAKAVGAYLIKSGINEQRISTIGFGSAQPIESNDTEEGRQANRRVQFILK